MKIECNAKINLGLNIVSKRTDGYHNIETVFYPLPIFDVLEFKPSGTWKFYTEPAIDCPPDKNLVIRAIRLLESKYSLQPLDISLYKTIPSGAGLGGGSSDAAFTLKALNQIFELNISEEELMETASKLGADCAFFIKNTAVFADQKGDNFSPCNISLKGLHFVLVKPEVSVSTAQAYSMVSPALPDFDLRTIGSLPINRWREKVKNDFENSVFAQLPEIAVIKQTLYDMGAVYASMSGSGSAVYGLFESSAPLQTAKAKFYKCTVFCGQMG